MYLTDLVLTDHQLLWHFSCCYPTVRSSSLIDELLDLDEQWEKTIC